VSKNIYFLHPVHLFLPSSLFICSVLYAVYKANQYTQDENHCVRVSIASILSKNNKLLASSSAFSQSSPSCKRLKKDVIINVTSSTKDDTEDRED
jgi:hypothetical protein